MGWCLWCPFEVAVECKPILEGLTSSGRRFNGSCGSSKRTYEKAAVDVVDFWGWSIIHTFLSHRPPASDKQTVVLPFRSFFFPFNEVISGSLYSTRFLEQAGRRLYHLMIGARNLWIKLGCLGDTLLGTDLTPYGEFCFFDRPLLPRLHRAPLLCAQVSDRDLWKKLKKNEIEYKCVQVSGSVIENAPSRGRGLHAQIEKGSNNRGGECR